MAKDVGAGSVLKIASAATPTSANLDDLSGNFTEFNTASTQGTVDITTLGNTSRTRDFLAGVMDDKISGKYLDDTSGALFKRLMAIRIGANHSAGVGKVDFRILIGGAHTGNLQVDGTMIVTDCPFDVGIETPLGGTFSGQVCGALV